MQVHLRTVFDLSKYALALYLAADTGKMLYESWIYESAFEYSGDQLDKIRQNLQVCDEKTNQLQSLLDKLVDIISAEDETNSNYNFMTKTYYDTNAQSSMSLSRIVQGLSQFKMNSRTTRMRDNALFNHVIKQYDKIAQDINYSLDKSKTQIVILRERTLQDKEQFATEKKKYTQNSILAGGVAAVSLGISTIFPPAAIGAGIALKASVGVPTFTGILSAINFYGSLSSQKNLEKALYRIRQFDEMETHVDQFKKTTLELIEQFKLQKKKWFRMLRRYERYERSQSRKRFYDQYEAREEPITATESALEFVVENLAACASALMIASAIAFFTLRQFSEQPLSPTQAFKWSVVLLGMCLMVSMFVDLMQAKNSSMQVMQHRNQARAYIQHKNLFQRYKRECIWYEIPAYQQIIMETGAAVLNWVPLLNSEYGFDSLTRNATGHLVHNKKCLKYEQQMYDVAMNLEESDMEQIGAVYMHPIKGVGKVISELFADAAETLNERTSLMTKVYMMLIMVGVVLLAFRRFLGFFCC
jgi:hypothetical protein